MDSKFFISEFWVQIRNQRPQKSPSILQIEVGYAIEMCNFKTFNPC